MFFFILVPGFDKFINLYTKLYVKRSLLYQTGVYLYFYLELGLSNITNLWVVYIIPI